MQKSSRFLGKLQASLSWTLIYYTQYPLGEYYAYFSIESIFCGYQKASAILIISCLTLLIACNSQQISDKSALGNNLAAQTNPDKIKRNSIDDRAQSNNHLDSNAVIKITDTFDP